MAGVPMRPQDARGLTSRDLLDVIVGGGEMAASLGTGFASQIPGGINASLLAMAGDPAPERAVESAADLLTYRPRTEAGKRAMARLGLLAESVGDKVSRVTRPVSDRVLQASPTLGPIALTAAEVAANAAGPKGKAPLRGLPTKATIKGLGEIDVGPVARVKQVADDYIGSVDFRDELPAVTDYVKVDPKKASAVAKAYDEMPHAPTDRKVKAAYNAMASETLAQWQAIKKSGLKVEFIREGMDDPYAASPRLAVKDIEDNNHLWVFPTDDGFGSSKFDPRGNPLLRDTDEVVDGRKMKVNDIFRIVHDYFGHAKEGVGFRADGEENAARVHSAMYSPLARQAMLTETRGQNSWVNFGPHGEKNRTASGADTVYADQKTGLLPEWAHDVDYVPPAPPRRRSKGQTVQNPQRTAYPELYTKSPKELAQMAEAWVEPEDPMLGRLFGVSRADLAKVGERSGNIEASLPGVTKKGAGSAAAQNVATSANAKRLVGLLDAGREYAPRLTEGMTGWYVMDPLYQKFVAELGEVEGKAAFERFNTMTGLSSPGSDVLSEINRGTTADMMASMGRFGDFLKYGGKPELHRSKLPQEARSLIGHPYHSTAHGVPMQKYLQGGRLDMKSPKVPTYIESSSVPEIGFQTSTPVGDAHWARGVGLADTRTAATDGVLHASVTNPEIKVLGPWYRDNVARQAGYEAVPAQANQWGLLGPITGVESALGAPKLELLAKQVAKTAAREGITPEDALQRLIRKKGQAGFIDKKLLGLLAVGGGWGAMSLMGDDAAEEAKKAAEEIRKKREKALLEIDE